MRKQLRYWCCRTPLDEPHVDGCKFSPEAGPIDYDGPVNVVELRPEDAKRRIYLGDGAYVETGNWPGEACVYTSNGVTRTNQVFLDVAMIDMLHEWAHAND